MGYADRKPIDYRLVRHSDDDGDEDVIRVEMTDTDCTIDMEERGTLVMSPEGAVKLAKTILEMATDRGLS